MRLKAFRQRGADRKYQLKGFACNTFNLLSGWEEK
jgi:hypothetical protein